MVSNLIGIEIIDQNPTYCRISQTAQPTKEEFKTILRRIFNIIKYTNQVIIEDLTKSDFKNLDLIEKQTKDVRRFALFCTRTLHKIFLVERKEESFLHLLLERLILIQHNQLYLYQKIIDQLKNKKSNINLKTIKYLEEAFEMFDIFTEMFYKKDFSKFKIINKFWKEIYFNKTQELFKEKTIEEKIIIYHLMYLSKQIFLIAQPGEVLVSLPKD